jgi:hypothetical protein
MCRQWLYVWSSKIKIFTPETFLKQTSLPNGKTISAAFTNFSSQKMCARLKLWHGEGVRAISQNWSACSFVSFDITEKFAARIRRLLRAQLWYFDAQPPIHHKADYTRTRERLFISMAHLCVAPKSSNIHKSGVQSCCYCVCAIIYFIGLCC